jgi:multiple sugar transport system substrate-binding protein
MAKAWGDERGVEVRVEIVPIRDVSMKATSWLQGPSGDLALLPSNLEMVNTDKLEDVSPLAVALATRTGGYYDIGQSMGQMNGHWYNIPFCAWPHVWFYREDLLRNLHAEIPKTYDEASVLAKHLTNTHTGVYGLGIGLGQDEDFAMFLQTTIWAFGGSVVGTDGHTVTVNSPQVLSAINYLLDLYNAGAIPPGALGWDDATNNNLFLAGRIAMTANALSIDYVAKRKDPNLYVNIVHSPYPAGPAGRFSFVQTFGWSIKKGSRNKDLAEDFLEYLYSVDRMSQLFLVSEGAIAPLQRNIGSAIRMKSSRYVDAIDSVELAKPLGWPGPFTREAAEVYNRRLLNNIFARIINDRLTPEKALAETEAEVRKVYAR